MQDERNGLGTHTENAIDTPEQPVVEGVDIVLDAMKKGLTFAELEKILGIEKKKLYAAADRYNANGVALDIKGRNDKADRILKAGKKRSLTKIIKEDPNAKYLLIKPKPGDKAPAYLHYYQKGHTMLQILEAMRKGENRPNMNLQNVYDRGLTLKTKGYWSVMRVILSPQNHHTKAAIAQQQQEQAKVTEEKRDEPSDLKWYQRGWTYEQIAKKLGQSLSKTRGRARQLAQRNYEVKVKILQRYGGEEIGAPKQYNMRKSKPAKKHKQPMADELADYQAGLTYQELATKRGMTNKSVQQRASVLKRLGFKPNIKKLQRGKASASEPKVEQSKPLKQMEFSTMVIGNVTYHLGSGIRDVYAHSPEHVKLA